MDTTFATRERQAIQQTLIAQRVKAKPTRPIITPAFVLYPLTLHPEERISSVEKAMPQVQLQLSNLRRRATHIRLQHPPLCIEAPHPAPETLHWRMDAEIPTHSMLAGRGYTFAGPEEQIVAFDSSPHTLIAGITGSGKSVMAQGMALSLALATSPAHVRYYVVDLKRDDLVPLQGLPHTAKFAGDPAQAIDVISAAHAEMERRRDHYGRPPFRLVIWIDELAQLPHQAQEQLKVITALGRSMLINVVAATQHPTAEVLGGSVGKINYTTRLVGLVADATAAATASGRTATGAEKLPGQGAFLRIEGPNTTRFQSYLLQHSDLRRTIRTIRSRWNGITPAQLDPGHRRPAEDGEWRWSDAPVAAEPAPDPVLAVFEEHRTTDGDMAHGWVAAAIRTAYGDDAARSGRRYQEQRADILDRFQAWTKTLPA